MRPYLYNLEYESELSGIQITNTPRESKAIALVKTPIFYSCKLSQQKKKKTILPECWSNIH